MGGERARGQGGWRLVRWYRREVSEEHRGIGDVYADK